VERKLAQDSVQWLNIYIRSAKPSYSIRGTDHLDSHGVGFTVTEYDVN
jgi:hypothetical protein